MSRVRPAKESSRRVRVEVPGGGSGPTHGLEQLEKAPSGINGLDDITGGGLPKGRPTLVCGSAGCGKTLMAMEFLVRGALDHGEPGLFVSFEEAPEELAKNVASLGFDLHDLEERKLLVIDQIIVDPSQIEEAGEFDLEGLFVRLNYAIDSIGAKRVVLDTIESLFSGFTNLAILRAELRRLFHWLKAKGVTTIITGERGEGALTRQGLEEYVSDCVILLDHRVTQQMSTRRLRIVKYRGSTHGTNEYPFLIDADGFSVLPLTSLGLNHGVSSERVTTGIGDLDAMLGGGIYRGTSLLVSGTAGTGKSSLCAHFADATCRAGETCLYFAFEESRDQIVRNMRSIGIDLEPHLKSGRLKFFNSRPSLYGLEMHLAVMHKRIREHSPSAVVVDPMSNLLSAGTAEETNSMLVRLIDFLKERQVTGMFTSLNHGTARESTEVAVSSLMDTWVLLRDVEVGGERNRLIYVLKSRGTAHSNQVREFLLSDQGVQLQEVYLGTGGVVTGSARLAQEARESVAEGERRAEIERKEFDLERKRKSLAAQAAALQADLEAEEAELERVRRVEELRRRAEDAQRSAMKLKRSSRESAASGNGKTARQRQGGRS